MTKKKNVLEIQEALKRTAATAEKGERESLSGRFLISGRLASTAKTGSKKK